MSGLWSAKLPIGVAAFIGGEETSAQCFFETLVVDGTGAGLPALLGPKSMRSKNTILILSSSDEELRLITMGEAGYNLELGAGAVSYPLCVSPSGQLLLRCDMFGGRQRIARVVAHTTTLQFLPPSKPSLFLENPRRQPLKNLKLAGPQNRSWADGWEVCSCGPV